MEPGLYLVATPIGNLDDITIRALNVLKNSDIIFCENTKNSSKLFKKYSIEAKYHKYTDHDFDRKKDEILQNIKQKKIISLISDSGSPLISDPGNRLINFLYHEIEKRCFNSSDINWNVSKKIKIARVKYFKIHNYKNKS